MHIVVLCSFGNKINLSILYSILQFLILFNIYVIIIKTTKFFLFFQYKELLTMNMFEVLASTASIISIPLAVYFARKNNSTTSEKARLDIIKTLSYKLSDTTYTLTHKDIDSVYKSKLREHEISHAKFNEEDILNDLKTNIMSNAFLSNDVKNNILYNLSIINFTVEKPIYILQNKRFFRIIRLFVSPIPYILFITNIIVCIILLCPHVFNIILHYIDYNELDNEFLYYFFKWLFNDHYLNIAFICLLILSVICFFRRKYIKKYF